MGLLVEQKQVVVPGTELAEGLDFVPSSGTYRLGEKIYASKLGLVNINKNVIKIVPLSGKYFPKEGDVVIGKIIDINSRGWVVDINCPYDAMMTLRDVTNDYVSREEDLTKYLKIDDWVLAKITRVTSTLLVDLTMKDKENDLRKLTDGRIIEFNPHKIPRIIGKQGSMINTIKKHLKLKFYVGLNGLIWFNGDVREELLFMKVVEMIDKYSHLSGLTERVDEFLTKAKEWDVKEIINYNV